MSTTSPACAAMEIHETHALDEAFTAERTHSRSLSDSNADLSDRSRVTHGTAGSSSNHRFTASRLRQRQTSPRISLGDAAESRIQQVFFPPFEEAGETSILQVETCDNQTLSFQRAALAPSVRLNTQTLVRLKARPTEGHDTTSLEHGRTRAQDSTTFLPPFRWDHRAHTSVSESDSGLQVHPSILRESGLLLNSASSFISHPLKPEQADTTMEVMEMRPRVLRRSVTASEDAENVKVSGYIISDSRLY